MQAITNTAELKNAIQLLELEHEYKGQILKEQFYIAFESFKPANLLKGTFKDMVTSPFLIENIVVNVLGMATGYLSKKIFVGLSGNIIRKMFGSVLQFGVTNAVDQHPDAIKSIVHSIFQHIFRKKEQVPSWQER
jgi:hypothetical protein